MPSLMQRIVREVLEGKQRAKNRIREHSHHGWKEIKQLETVVLMECPCGWVGWIPKENKNNDLSGS